MSESDTNPLNSQQPTLVSPFLAGYDELQDAIRYAITLKPERHEFNEQPEQIVRFMSVTGG